jgi:hypothetical protein
MKNKARYFAVTKYWLQEVDELVAGEEGISSGWNVWKEGDSNEIVAALVRVGRGPYFMPIREYPSWIRNLIKDYIKKYPEWRATERHQKWVFGEGIKRTGAFKAIDWIYVFGSADTYKP